MARSIRMAGRSAAIRRVATCRCAGDGGIATRLAITVRTDGLAP
ncbi:hypothetical protein [Sediminicoccus rosea]|jgi:hypothetical protein|uniref:Uncharacterized protein n=1 Tax=Sediminicoccus rosea TaxID=1225128 RepID=A0ABZ0PED8_9PROT|nr:hypothetical protein [Sediminicoccus rosea]WPB83861.1 hypothetical protein R9Z33_17305 [Sediminicoccus rosea]